jgi:hypothetical protein
VERVIYSWRGQVGAGRCRDLEGLIQRWNKAQRLNRRLGSRGGPDLRRIQYTIREATAVVAASALVCFGLRVAPLDLLGALAVIIAGSVTGAATQRLRGGCGVLGAALGGATAYIGLLAVLCLWLYLNPQTKTWIADPVNAFLFAAVYGALIGSVVGLLVRMWGRPFRSRGHSNG